MAARKESLPTDATESAVQAEAEGVEMVSVEFDGHTFTFPQDALNWTVGTRRAFKRTDLDEGIPLLLGDQFTAAGGDDWTGHKLNDLALEIGKAAGFGDVGE